MRKMYVLGNDIYLKRRSQKLALMQGKEVLEEVDTKDLNELIVIGYASMSGAVLKMLVENRVETILLDPKGRFQARLFIDEHKHVQRRQQQYLKLSDPSISKSVAKEIVIGKLRSQSRFLSLKAKGHEGQVLPEKALSIRALLQMLEGQEFSLESLRGLEGTASRLYYEAFGHLIKNRGFVFQGRNKRPPRDPVNALLSFVYTLLTSEVLNCIKTVGLDPFFGCLHEIEYGRPSLACDLVEEWRVFLGDRFVLTLLNKNLVRPDDFIYRETHVVEYIDETDLKNNRPVEMKRALMKVLLESYEKWMAQKIKSPISNEVKTYRGLIMDQVRLFEKYIMDDCERYTTFPWSKVY